MKYLFYRNHLLLGGILMVSAFLLAFRMQELMMFIGDFGFFYLSARDMLIHGSLPLVSIPTSHPWLHQGPVWTYLLALTFGIVGFNPLNGAILSTLFGLFSVFLIYILGKELFTEKIGLIAAILMATSPLVIIHARMPYHTAPIPFFTLLLMLSTVFWLKGKAYAFPIVLFSLATLYNLELATIVYFALILSIIIYGLFKKTAYTQILRGRKLFLLSLLSFLIPMMPILLYDMDHNYPQTIRFAMWMGYKILTVFGYPPLHPEIPSATYLEIGMFFFEHMRKLLFLPHLWIAGSIFIVSIGYFIRTVYTHYKTRSLSPASVVVILFLLFGIGGFFATKTLSEAYLPMLFPPIILVVAYALGSMMKQRLYVLVILSLLTVVVGSNILTLLNQNYLMGIRTGGYGPTFEKRIAAAEYMVKAAGKNKYTIQEKESSCMYSSYVMNYKYLTWWLGNGSSQNIEPLRFTVTDTTDAVIISPNKKL